MHPSVADELVRGQRRRFVGLLLFAPVLMSVAAVLLMAERAGASLTLAGVLMFFGLSWLGVLAVAGLRHSRWVEAAVLTASIPLMGMVTTAAGGLASPASLLLLAIPLEAYGIRPTRKALIAGAAAVAAAVGSGLLMEQAWPAVLGAASAWHWLLPLSYGATLWPRLAARQRSEGDEARAKESDARMDLVDGAVLKLARSGEVVEAGAKARTVLNLAPELLHGAGLFDRVHVADRVNYMCALGALRDGEQQVRTDVRLRLPKAEGTDGPDNFRHFAIEFHADVDREEFIAVLRDDSEVADLRAALREATDETEALDIAKGRFLAAVSHELRTPLNAIIGFSDILLHEMFGGFSDARQREYTELIKESGHHLLSVVNAILDVSKIESGAYPIHTETFAFGDAAEMCRSMMSLQAEKKGVDLRTQVGRAVGEVVADRRAVQQILINLVSNAIKFTPEGGSVVVGAQRLGSRLHFWVADTGIGIAEEDLDRIGRPFTQIRNDYTRQFEGAGLGLSLVKGLVSLHEGTMSIESAPGEGTKVAISLPVSGPALASVEETGLVRELVHKETIEHGALLKTA